MIRTANLTLSVSRKAGGLFDSVRRLVQCLAQTGMDVRVLAARDEFTDADLPAWKPTAVLAFKPTWPKRFGYSPQFHQELFSFKPEITHTHGIWVYPSIATNLYCRKSRTPYLISSHGMLDRWAIQNSHWKKAIANVLYERAHLRDARCLRALCEPEARAIRDLRLANDIAIIPNGVDLPRGLPTMPAPWSGLIQPGQKILLFLGRIHPKKGLVNLIKAWAAGGNSPASDWVLAIAGWEQGSHEQELKRLATDSGIVWTDVRANGGIRNEKSARPPSVLFLGGQFGDAKNACFHYCDGFILPSLSEGVPMAVLEAWVNSKPVLITPQCNLPEAFALGAALKIDPTVESLTGQLRVFCRLADSEHAAMGSKGYALATDRFVWPRVAEQMKVLYEWMLGGGPRPACLADF